MTGLDTNILVRYFMRDDPTQSPKAIALIEDLLTEDNPGFIGTATLVEFVWVLTSKYRRTKEQVLHILEVLLKAENLVVQSEQDVFVACMLTKAGRTSFPDALIGELNASAGCMTTLTFDQQASRLPAFRLL